MSRTTSPTPAIKVSPETLFHSALGLKIAEKMNRYDFSSITAEELTKRETEFLDNANNNQALQLVKFCYLHYKHLPLQSDKSIDFIDKLKNVIGKPKLVKAGKELLKIEEEADMEIKNPDLQLEDIYTFLKGMAHAAGRTTDTSEDGEIEEKAAASSTIQIRGTAIPLHRSNAVINYY